jgi:hypothetical protein
VTSQDIAFDYFMEFRALWILSNIKDETKWNTSRCLINERVNAEQ